ncbi:MAG: ERAP1-like C-terminal domain-containing protein [Candidatus Eremiobacteraeota bacterium]|nr:ERAP1-like C-terminal domain-containing protein [Candidatus Eremiobacteraeota bacterium]
MVELSSIAHRNVGALVDPWIATPGVPIVDVSAKCSGGRRSLALSQHRFFVEPGQHSSQLWSIPVALEIAGKTSYILLDGPSATVDAGACGDPLVVNAGALGYYGVDLDTASAGALIANFPSLGVTERARAIGDAGASMLAGAAPPQRLFATIAAVQPSDALTVWNAVLRSLSDISDLEAGQPGRASFDAYRRRVLAPVLARVGWDARPGEDPQTESLRAELLGSLGASGDKIVIAEAQRRFARFASDPASLAPALREPVLTIAGTYGDAATWDTLHALFVAAKSPVEGRQYAMALWNSRDPQLAAKNLAMAANGEITSEYGAELAYYDIVMVALSGEQPEAAWSYFKAHHGELASKLSAFERPLVTAAIAPLFWNAAPATELDALIDGTPALPPASAARAKHAIEVRLAQRARIVPLVDAALASPVTK